MERPCYTYQIRFNDWKYYKSKHEYVSVDYTAVENEIDTTVLNEEDLFYLLEEDECIRHSALVEVILNGYYVGTIPADVFVREGQ